MFSVILQKENHSFFLELDDNFALRDWWLEGNYHFQSFQQLQNSRMTLICVIIFLIWTLPCADLDEFESLPFWCQESVIIGYSVVDNRNLWKILRLVAQCKISPASPFFIVVSFKLLEVTTTLSQAIFQVVSSGSNRWQDAMLVARQLEDKIVVSKIRHIRK